MRGGFEGRESTGFDPAGLGSPRGTGQRPGVGVGATESQIRGHEATGRGKVVLGARGEGGGPPKGQSKGTRRVGRLRNIQGGGEAPRGGAQVAGGVVPRGIFLCSLSVTSELGGGLAGPEQGAPSPPPSPLPALHWGDLR